MRWLAEIFYAHDHAEALSIYEQQRRRRAHEPESRDWDTVRDALVECGAVDDARKAREEQAP